MKVHIWHWISQSNLEAIVFKSVVLIECWRSVSAFEKPLDRTTLRQKLRKILHRVPLLLHGEPIILLVPNRFIRSHLDLTILIWCVNLMNSRKGFISPRWLLDFLYVGKLIPYIDRVILGMILLAFDHILVDLQKFISVLRIKLNAASFNDYLGTLSNLSPICHRKIFLSLIHILDE